MKKEIEADQLRALLKRLGRLGHEAPSDIQASERPDFIVTIGGQRIGIETTRAVYQEQVRAEKIHIRRLPDQCIDTTHLIDRVPRRSNDEIVAEILNLNSEWKDSETGMRDWRLKIEKAIADKRTKFAKPGFQILDENWLLICDEPPLGDDVFTYDRACHHMADIVSNPYNGSPDFDVTFVHSGRYLFRIKQGALSLHYANQESEQDGSGNGG
jgi:hypothetical protein